MKRFCKGYEEEQAGVVQGKDPQRAASIKSLEEVGDVDCLDQDARDEESRKAEEEIHANEHGVTDMRQEIEYIGARMIVRPQEVVRQDHQNGETANPI